MQCALFAYQYVGAVDGNCYKPEIFSGFGTCIAVMNLTFVVLS